MKSLLCVFLVAVLVGPVIGEERSLAGRWIGKLGAPDRGLRVIFNVHEKGDGSMTATMDSPDQGAARIPVSNVEHRESRWTFEVPQVQGKYAGIEQADGSIKGTWTQGPQSLSLNLQKTGLKFEGSIEPPGRNLMVVFRIEEKEVGGYTAELDSPDQGASGIAVDTVALDDQDLTMTIEKIRGVYTGVVQGGSIVGKWSQAGVSFPLTLKRSNK